MPTWVGVVGALSLAVLAAAGVVLAATHLVAARRLEQFAHLLEQLAGPAVSDVRQLVATIRTEADGLAGTSRELRARIVKAADAAEARLQDLDALFVDLCRMFSEDRPHALVIKRRMAPGIEGAEGNPKAHEVLEAHMAIAYLKKRGGHTDARLFHGGRDHPPSLMLSSSKAAARNLGKRIGHMPAITTVRSTGRGAGD